jgi:hypothetical protein
LTAIGDFDGKQRKGMELTNKIAAAANRYTLLNARNDTNKRKVEKLLGIMGKKNKNKKTTC